MKMMRIEENVYRVLSRLNTWLFGVNAFQYRASLVPIVEQRHIRPVVRRVRRPYPPDRR